MKAPTSRVASPVHEYLAGLHSRFASRDNGQVASYIPELAKADPASFGICIAMADGHVYEVGGTRRAFRPAWASGNRRP